MDYRTFFKAGGEVFSLGISLVIRISRHVPSRRIVRSREPGTG
jgi:hypothetical protein